MNRFQHVCRRPLVLVVALASALVASGALAQQYPSTSAGSQSTATPPSTSPSTGAMKGSAGMPSRTDSANAAWQKLGSKGYVAKDDVKDLSGFSFDTADANHDGRLSQDEFNKAWSSYSGASHPTNTNTMRGSSSMPSSGNSAPSGATPK